jgi:hypothetical protein
MWLLPKKLFEWHEPSECRRAILEVEAARARWWVKPACALLFTGLMLLTWLLASFSPNKQPPPFGVMLPVYIALALLFAYGYPWLLSVCPAYVVVSKDRIGRVVLNSRQTWKWKEVKGYDWRSCGEFDLLILQRRRGTEVLVGVSPEVSRIELEQFLADRGLARLEAEVQA